MALPSSGPISLSQVQTEFGGSNPISLSEYYRNGAYVTSNNTSVPTSGTIDLADFYGTQKAIPITLNITSHKQEYNLLNALTAAGWDGLGPVTVNISSGVYIWSDSTSTAALIITGSYPNGLIVNNSGYIMGRGGDNGRLQYYAPSGYSVQSVTGGPAISVSSSSVTINNQSSGYILGGGGAGASSTTSTYDLGAAHAGGGGAGGGTGGHSTSLSETNFGGAIGQDGQDAAGDANWTTYSAGGGGGAGGWIWFDGSSIYTTGGQGGGRKAPPNDNGGVSGTRNGSKGGNGGTAGNVGGNAVAYYVGSSVVGYGSGGGGGYGARGGNAINSLGTTVTTFRGSGGAAISGSGYTLSGTTGNVYGSV